MGLTRYGSGTALSWIISPRTDSKTCRVRNSCLAHYRIPAIHPWKTIDGRNNGVGLVSTGQHRATYHDVGCGKAVRVSIVCQTASSRGTKTEYTVSSEAEPLHSSLTHQSGPLTYTLEQMEFIVGWVDITRHQRSPSRRVQHRRCRSRTCSRPATCVRSRHCTARKANPHALRART